MDRTTARLQVITWCSLLTFAATPAPAQAPADSAAAVTGVRDFLTACARDGGRLWGESLCGRLIAVDGRTGFSVATERPPEGVFQSRGALWIGRVPEGMQVANTSYEWDGSRWSTVRLPLPSDRFERIRLLAHEAFHRIQPDLQLNAPDALNPQLDERDGRYLLRLELRALAAAVRTTGAASSRATRDALLFRARRNQLYPGSDTLETALETQEGLAEYTGTVLALAATGLSADRAARAAAEFESRPTYVRSLGYGTGPLLGLLLDRVAPHWRTRIREAGIARQLARATRFVASTDLAAAVAARAAAYGGDELAREEDERAAGRARMVADYRARLVEGPVVVLAADELYRSFNPNTLVPLGAHGTVYPTGRFTADWGLLSVDEGGALLAPGNREVRVPAPETLDTAAAAVDGPGWRLQLRSGWRLRSGQRAGDFTVERVQP
jgi:hypothetical protein